ncbi:MAG TPA: aromatic ring-hydroxylating dioxygenase subunit alpha [Candidatus Methylomirabilis sp.]|nr:aromatic ring-hydroxylating dioxygenase subunit alpha [Candidatus Methylomirabilis sp.]
MLTQAQQERLTRVGPGTPMGTLLRRYWMPLAASIEVPSGTARTVRLLGEDLVLFRSTRGELGLLDERCPHRGTSLADGCVDEAGIRCAYHGWKFAATGACLEVSGRTDPDLLARARTRAYRAEELGGLIFAYLGPEPAPLLPRWDLMVWSSVLRDIGRAIIPCNWLQIMENSVDPIHLEWLHGHHLAAVRRRNGLPAPTQYPRRHVEIGFDRFRYGIIKRRVLQGGSRDDDDWRVGHPLVFPNMVRVGADGQHRLQIRVPVDDTQTLHFWYCCWVPPSGVTVSQDEVPVYEVPFRDERGEFILDFVDGGDIMAWVSQGPINDRTRELLVESDEGIALFRALLREQIETVASGGDPMGVIRDRADNEIIELPQERNKYGRGREFLRDAIQLSHVRYSPIRERLLEIFSGSG